MLEKSYGIMFSKALDARQASTYEVYANFGMEGVKELVENADKFAKKIRELLQM